jgi:excisionase family DNA binding protein
MNTELLTAQQVQRLLDVDASTIYRMAGDGRLPAVRIGRQWRFPAAAIRSILPSVPTDDDHRVERSPTVISGDVATAVLEAIAPALGVTMVVTDLAGQPISSVVNPAPAIAARLDDPEFLAACTTEWQAFADEAHLAPRLRAGRLGFLCAHGLVRRGPSLVAMVLAGGIAPDDVDDPALFRLDADRREVVLDTLPRTAALLSRLVTDQPSPI